MGMGFNQSGNVESGKKHVMFFIQGHTGVEPSSGTTTSEDHAPLAQAALEALVVLLKKANVVPPAAAERALLLLAPSAHASAASTLAAEAGPAEHFALAAALDEAVQGNAGLAAHVVLAVYNDDAVQRDSVSTASAAAVRVAARALLAYAASPEEPWGSGTVPLTLWARAAAAWCSGDSRRCAAWTDVSRWSFSSAFTLIFLKAAPNGQ